MIDRDVVAAKLVELDKRVHRVAAVRKANALLYQDDEAATELTAFNLMLAVQCAIDLGAHLIADRDWSPAVSSAEVFDRLAEHGVIPKELSRPLRDAVGFRNTVAHGYVQLRTDLLHQAATRGLDDLIAFSQHFASWVSRQP
ncbi:MAG TPA: DUF86 domain-containing protein [Polyangiales bacterium]|nr:DUF86 domain-containing protein [Polyangiales bacterium]